MQEVFEKKQPQIFCIKHKRREILYANLNLNKNIAFPFCCYLCFVENQENELYVSIAEILENDDQYLSISNWPRGMSKKSKEYLEETSENGDNKFYQLREQITHFYDEMVNELATSIRDIKKQKLMMVDKYELQIQQLYDFYNKTFRRQELKQIFLDKNRLSSERYYEFLNSLEETREKDLRVLEEDIVKLREIGRGIDQGPEKQTALKEQIKKLISQMNFEYPNNENEKQCQTSQSINTNTQENGNGQQSFYKAITQKNSNKRKVEDDEDISNQNNKNTHKKQTSKKTKQKSTQQKDQLNQQQQELETENDGSQTISNVIIDLTGISSSQNNSNLKRLEDSHIECSLPVFVSSKKTAFQINSDNENDDPPRKYKHNQQFEADDGDEQEEQEEQMKGVDEQEEEYDEGESESDINDFIDDEEESDENEGYY